MKRIVLGVLVIGLMVTATALSTQRALRLVPQDSAGKIHVTTEEKNPWTHLKVNNDPGVFRFAITTDRTGSHRAQVFSRAVQQINLLQPEFVMSVGDLIEGYSQKPEQIDQEWEEFEGYVRQLQMPYFFVPGNHDLTNAMQAEKWSGRFGRAYYHFVYKDVLFLAINSEDGKGATISPAQVESIRKVLAENQQVRWTFVFLHKPLWTHGDLQANGWEPVEKALAGRKYTVFCGHVHRYQKFVRNGMNYYQLATTGGGSKLRGVEYGEFDHVAWVTMKPDGPVIANVVLDKVLPEDLKAFPSEETGAPLYEMVKNIPLHPVTVTVTQQGKPVSGAIVTFHGAPIPSLRERDIADGLTGADGTVILSTLQKQDGVPAGDYRVTVYKLASGTYYDGPVNAPSVLPAKYVNKETSGLTARIVAGENRIDIALQD